MSSCPGATLKGELKLNGNQVALPNHLTWDALANAYSNIAAINDIELGGRVNNKVIGRAEAVN